MTTDLRVPSEPRFIALLRTHADGLKQPGIDTLAHIDAVTSIATAAVALVGERDKEIETLHLQAAACMTATFQNTRESAKERIGRDHPYWTQAYADVCTSVDREIRERERAEASEHNFAIEHERASAAEAECGRLRKDADAKQAKIDMLMLEYCPDEMTPEQLKVWGDNQRAVTPEEEACLK